MPHLRNYPEFNSGTERAVAPGAPGQPPKLPPLPQLGQPNRAMGLRPIRVAAAGNGPERSVKIQPTALDPSGMQPLQQLIYGGTHPTHDQANTYRFHVRDKFRITISGHPEFTGPVEVLQDGSVNIPNTEDYVLVKDLSVEQASRVIAMKVAPYTKDEPKVRLTVTFGRGEFYYIFGEVRNQGRFPMGLAPVRLSEAIFRANSESLGTSFFRSSREARLREESEVTPREEFSLPPYANLRGVSVITPHRSRPTRRVYNVNASLLQGVTGDDPVIRPGQIIFVPSTADARVMRFFRRVIEPLTVLADTDSEGTYWYQRISGNTANGVSPAEHKARR